MIDEEDLKKKFIDLSESIWNLKHLLLIYNQIALNNDLVSRSSSLTLLGVINEYSSTVSNKMCALEKYLMNF